MNIELRHAAADDGPDVYGMLQEMLPNDNGFENGAHGISAEEYKVWLKRRVAFSLGEGLADWQVPENTYWLYADGLPVGYGKLRHRLTEALREAGGHIGYGIRPTQRGKGYGSLILKLLLRKAGELGIADVLIDCFAENEPSRKVIEANRGVLERRTDKRLYYRFALKNTPAGMSEPAAKVELTAEEAEFKKLVRETYNSGRVKEACEMAENFYRGRQESLLGKFYCAAMAGDYSDDILLSAEKRGELLALARKLIKEVYEDKRAPLYEFWDHVRNEYFWFHQLHSEQYALGAERVAAGAPRGYYSMCVGASAMAKKCLLENNDLGTARAWAEKAVSAFHEFEKLDPDWHNINHFYAYALAVLGDYDAALKVYKDMYRKQKAAINEKEVAVFLENMEKIKEIGGGNVKK